MSFLSYNSIRREGYLIPPRILFRNCLAAHIRLRCLYHRREQMQEVPEHSSRWQHTLLLWLRPLISAPLLPYQWEEERWIPLLRRKYLTTPKAILNPLQSKEDEIQSGRNQPFVMEHPLQLMKPLRLM